MRPESTGDCKITGTWGCLLHCDFFCFSTGGFWYISIWLRIVPFVRMPSTEPRTTLVASRINKMQRKHVKLLLKKIILFYFSLRKYFRETRVRISVNGVRLIEKSEINGYWCIIKQSKPTWKGICFLNVSRMLNFLQREVHEDRWSRLKELRLVYILDFGEEKKIGSRLKKSVVGKKTIMHFPCSSWRKIKYRPRYVLLWLQDTEIQGELWPRTLSKASGQQSLAPRVGFGDRSLCNVAPFRSCQISDFW